MVSVRIQQNRIVRVLYGEHRTGPRASRSEGGRQDNRFRLWQWPGYPRTLKGNHRRRYRCGCRLQSEHGIQRHSNRWLRVPHSQLQIDKAKENGLESVYVQDIQAMDDEFVSELLAKHGRFDKVFSNAVLHWCKRDPAGVIRSAKKVLKPGGTFAVEFGGWGNCIGRALRTLRPSAISFHNGLRCPFCSTLGVAQERV